ncbi:gamma-glutamylcyclotransferase family protein [Herbidospora sp. NBRC 101105]|uniref:gamma-glutamylcyclotransferase family protein n=1 Tax=Herbidospora sp. NBRC 101105 TaxID=3032195 RepID=UPI0024A37B3C|nr:gamma-glutamylcyclotransferase family protein [Herbidospora sp. NBRC 101105]GLX99235.1 UDP-N-acetylmuramate--alanine ligase [Herbidospora sp. NBRC 101105]
MIFLFSYGTLQLERVQLAQFGRRLEGRPDALPNHRLTTITIPGGTFPIVQRSPGDEVLGLIYQLSPAELAAADAYEGVEYARRLRTLKSGLTAWVYLSNESV